MTSYSVYNTVLGYWFIHAVDFRVMVIVTIKVINFCLSSWLILVEGIPLTSL